MDQVHEAVTVTYSGDTGRMTATYSPMSEGATGRGSVNGYGENRAVAAAKAAQAAVLNVAQKRGWDHPDWLTDTTVGRIGRNKYVVVFTRSRA